MAAVGALLALLVAVGVEYYKREEPTLVYDVFPVSSFYGRETNLSIHAARIENIGNKEARQVQVHLKLPENGKIQEEKITPSLESIQFNSVPSSAPNIKEYQFDLLNPGDWVIVSVLATDTGERELTVEVRAIGITGSLRTSSKESSRNETPLIALAGVLAGLVASLSTSVLVFTVRRQRDSLLKRAYDLTERITRTKSTIPNEEIRSILLSRNWRLYFNPATGGSKRMQFAENGGILTGRNNNESNWRIHNGFLEILNSESRVFSRFYYSQKDERFYHTNDEDTLSIRDQYIISEA
jgi:hypothetical protein